MNRPTLVILLTVFAFPGCQSPRAPKTTVIAPPAAERQEPQIKWVKRGNVYYLQRPAQQD